MSRGVLQSDVFYCEHIGRCQSDITDIERFSVLDQAGEGLVDYIRHYALRDEKSGIMRTYLVRSLASSELVGYFSLKSGLISINEVETVEGTLFDTVPGVELANFAINGVYINAHPSLKGIGTVVFERFILPIIKQAASVVGVKIVYIFALPYDRLINRYKEYGFLRLDQQAEEDLHSRVKPVYDDGCIFMYQMLT